MNYYKQNSLYFIDLQKLLNVSFLQENGQGNFMLHIIDNFPLQRSFLETTHSGDTVILKDNAVYAVKQENIKESHAAKTLAHLNICVSKADLLLRNMSNHELLRGVVILDNINDYQDILLDHIACRSCN